MKVYDKSIKKIVDVCERECTTENRSCYWKRPYPGVFVPGKGYQQTDSRKGYIFGTREIHGCPDEYCES